MVSIIRGIGDSPAIVPVAIDLLSSSQRGAEKICPGAVRMYSDILINNILSDVIDLCGELDLPRSPHTGLTGKYGSSGVAAYKAVW